MKISYVILEIIMKCYLNDDTLRLNNLNMFILLLGNAYECACVCAYYSERTATKKYKLKKKYILFIIFDLNVVYLFILEDLNLFSIVPSKSFQLLYFIQNSIVICNELQFNA